MELRSTVIYLLAVMVTACFAQKKCCFPDMYEAFLEESIAQIGPAGDPSMTTATVKMAFDYTNKRRAYLRALTYKGVVQHEQKIYDYKEGVFYDADMEATFCNRIKFSGPMQNCIPDSATYQGTFYAGNNSLTEDVFRFSIVEPTDYGNVTIGVSVPACIPIRSIFAGHYDGCATYLTSVYRNFTEGISDPAKYFTIPSFCPKKVIGTL